MEAKDRLKELIAITKTPSLPAYKQLKEALDQPKGTDARRDALKAFFGIDQNLNPKENHISGGWIGGNKKDEWPDDQTALVNAPGSADTSGDSGVLQSDIWWPG
ncbi:MAG: hypothetical protein ACFFCZ_10275 [Promethearchaeota archaeon]